MGKGDLLAGEQTGVGAVVAHEHGERRFAGHAEREAHLHLGRHRGVRNRQAARVLVFVLDGRQTDGKVLGRLFDLVLAGLVALRDVVDETGGGGGGFLHGIPNAEELYL